MSNRFKILCLQGLCLCIMSQNNIIFNEDCNTHSITEYWDVTGIFCNECTEYDSFDSEICHDYVCEIIDTDSALTRIIPGKFDGVSLTFDFLNSNRIGSCVVEYSTDCGRNWNTIMEYSTSNPIEYISTKNAFIGYDYTRSYEFRIRFRSNNADICAFDNIMFNGVSVNETLVNEKSTTPPTNNPTLISSIPPTSIARNTITTTVGTSIYIDNQPESRSVNNTVYQKSTISLKILVFIIILISGLCLSCGICTIFIIWFIINGGFKTNKEIIDNIKWIHHNDKHSESIQPASIQNDTIVKIPEIIPSPTFGDKPSSINNEGSINDSCKPGDTVTFNGDKHKKIIELEGETGVDSAELCIPYRMSLQKKAENV